MEQKHLYDYLLQLQAITKIGLKYSTDPYAISNYKQIETLTVNMLEQLQNVNLERNNYFKRDVYPTPNISVRTIIFNEKNEFLMVKEVADGTFSLPGGWCDLYDAPSIAAIREVKEEAGADVTITNLVAVLNNTPFKSPLTVPEYVIVFKAKLNNITNEHDHEISEVGWFTAELLPKLSHKMSVKQLQDIITAALSGKIIYD